MVTVAIDTKVTGEVIIISISDIQGKEVYHAVEKNNATTYTKQINLEAVSKGIYYIKLTTESDRYMQKLSIQ